MPLRPSPEGSETGVLGYATTDIATTSRPPVASGAGPATWRPSLEPGAVLAERYRIVTFLARGGMGEVYEAEDLTLSMRIALKSIASEVAADARMIERLKREVLLARKVTHPNVCRLHDLGFHRDERGTIAFLTMDLLRGVPLAVHLARKGRLEAAEVLPLLRQIAAGLDAAHDAGVIHRDLKTRNVMLVDGEGPGGGVRATPGTGGPRAVVMDFGIALAAEDDELRALDTGEGRFLGTPAYMAPEQVSGTEVTPATDVYSLGVMLFELVTGTLPFLAPSSLETITMRLTQPAPPPRSRVRSLDRRWNDAILRCLEREPSARFARASEVVAAVTAPRRIWTRRRAAWGAAAAATVLALAAARGLGVPLPWTHETGAGMTDALSRRRPALAVLSLQNGAGAPDAEWLSTALVEMLATELAADGQLRVLPGDRVSRAERDLALASPSSSPPGGRGSPSAARLASLRENLGADYVVSGGYKENKESTATGEGRRVQIDLALHDTRTGATLKTLSADADEADLFAGASSLAVALRKKLGVRAPSMDESARAHATLPESPEGARAYAEGRAKVRAYDFGGAITAFERAVAAEPRFPLAHAGLAGALAALGFDARAQEEARRAFELSGGLPRADQLRVESRFRSISKQWDRAVEIDHTLFEFFPDDTEYGLLYVRSLIAAGRSDDALRVLGALRDLPPPDCDDPRIDAYEAVAASKISDFKRQLAAGRAAAAKAEKTGAELILADAHHHIAESLAALGRPDESMVERELARSLYAKLGDRDGEAGELAGVAMLRLDGGDPAGALPLLERSLEIERQVGARYKIANRVNELGEARMALGEIAAARARWEEAHALYEAIGDREGMGNTLGNLATALTAQGDLGGAKRAHLDAIDLLRGVGARSSLLGEALSSADLALEMGELAEAERLERDASAKNEKMESGYFGAMGAALRSRLARETGDLAASRREGEAALEGFEKEQARAEAGEALVLLARIALDEGRLGDADSLGKRAADEATTRHLKSVEGDALAVLITAEARAKRGTEAAELAARAAALGVESVATRIDLALAEGERLDAVPGARDGARRAREAAWALAQAGFVARGFEVKLARARSLAAPERARELQKIAAEARGLGFARIARAAGAR